MKNGRKRNSDEESLFSQKNSKKELHSLRVTTRAHSRAYKIRHMSRFLHGISRWSQEPSGLVDEVEVKTFHVVWFSTAIRVQIVTARKPLQREELHLVSQNDSVLGWESRKLFTVWYLTRFHYGYSTTTCQGIIERLFFTKEPGNEGIIEHPSFFLFFFFLRRQLCITKIWRQEESLE